MTHITPFTFPATGQPVRTVTINCEPWWIAADICAVLEIGRPQDSVRYLEEDERGRCPVDTPSGQQDMLTINEPGLYSLILRSRKPQARAFKRWITHEVIPAIRRTGSYSVAPVEMTKLEALQAAIESEQARLAAEARVAELEPAARAYDILASAHGDYSLRDAAHILNRDPRITTGQNRLMATLRELRMVDRRGIPYARHSTHLVERATTYTHPHTGETALTAQIRITANGLRYLRDRLTIPDTPDGLFPAA